MKNRKKEAGKLQSKKWGFEADFEDWQEEMKKLQQNFVIAVRV